MKVLWICSWYPNDEVPENGDFIQRMAEAVSQYCEVIILCAVEGKGKEIVVDVKRKRALSEYIVYYPKINIKVPIVSHLLRGMLYFISLWKGLKRIKARNDFLLIHLNVIFPAGYFAWIYSLVSKKRLVITEHWTGYSDYLSDDFKWWHWIVAKLSVWRASIVLPVSNSLMSDLVKRFSGKYKVIPNVVDLERFEPDSKTVDENTFQFIIVANLFDKTKNISGVIRAFSSLSSTVSNTKLKIIGDGVDRGKLEKIVDKYLLNDRVEFCGALSHRKVARYMQESQALVVFSNVETFSCVIAEAFAVGLPIIASRSGGLTDSIDELYGITVDPLNEVQLEEAMKEMVSDYERFNPGVRRNISKGYERMKVGRQIYDIYLSNS